MEAFQFHPAVARWFEQEFGSPSEPQERGWPAIKGGAHVLISAPTGSGKTLAAFLASLDQLFREGLAHELPDETRVLYVSPLKALSNDIHKNLERPLTAIRHLLKDDHGHEVDVRAEVRTGDTPAAKRQSIIKKPPHILVTTPESFYLLLTSESGRKLLAPVRTVIVDEIHAVVGNRRGSHLALSIERLVALAKHPLQRIGLSATQKPIEEVARFLTGSNGSPCTIINCDYRRQLDVAIELPGSPLEAVMSNEVWEEVYGRLAELIAEHETTLVFTNTRRLAERVAHNLGSRIGADKVTSHHGSLSAKLRLDAENRLKRGELKALVATASLELGIDIGSIGLVCQIGPTHSLATFLQRIGRAEHRRGGLPKGRIFPLSRDELVAVTALLRGIRNGELDALQMPQKPLDVLAQQIVACAASGDWQEDQLFELMRSAYPYRELTRKEFDDVVRMLAEGFSTKRGRRAALLHRDAINRRLRGRRGARLVALTSGGAIADNADFRVIMEPTETFIGTVNEDFAVESMAGDIFQLGNASWRILKVDSGAVRVEDAHGQPPGMPFWLGEAPGRTDELSEAVSRLRFEVDEKIRRTLEKDGNSDGNSAETALVELLKAEAGLPTAGAQQLAEYFAAIHRSLGTIPSQQRLVLERFFDESGGMQLVVHSPYGVRVNRAWGLALRKRFCRSFNFELQAAATEDAIVLSLGTQHSFPLEDVFHFLNTNTVRELLIQALLDAPMFPIRWRWNATRSLALPRQRNGRKTPAQLQRMESENLLAAVFPDQLACLENIAGDRVVPEHPLVEQTIEDCLTEAMDFDGLAKLLKRIEAGAVELIARDLPEPSPLAHEILNAKPYAFLDNAPLEERRTQAVYLRRAADTSSAGLGILDSAAIEKVRAEAWPAATNADELHEALLLIGVMTEEEIRKTTGGSTEWLDLLVEENRAASLPDNFWAAAENLEMLRTIFGDHLPLPPIPALRNNGEPWEREAGVRELVRGRIEVSGPTTAGTLARILKLQSSEIDTALLALEAEGFVLRGKFHPDASETEWCDRRLLARIHRLTIHRLRAEIEAVSLADFQGFLLAWQRASTEHRVEGPEGVKAVLDLLDGYQLPAAAWEPEVLALRVKNYTPAWLDQLCFTGRIGWSRLTPPQTVNGRLATPVRSSPISIYTRENLPHWLALSAERLPAEFSPDANQVLETLKGAGALFFGEIVRRSGLLPTRVENAIAELVAMGWVTSDSFEGLRALLVPDEKREPFAASGQRRRHRSVTSIEFAGRWSAIRSLGQNPGDEREVSLEIYARTLLRRYGVIFRRLLEKESLGVTWFETLRICRRLEAQGDIRGGYFVSGVSGEQFALPEAVGLLRAIRRQRSRNGQEPRAELITISAADPLNLVGILAPGPRIAAVTAHRILLRDGTPVAALKADQLIPLEPEAIEHDYQLEKTLRVGTLSPALRPYYA
jgi:ATP-dependent helicase Lhr and Lhr-like helicase